MRITVDRNSLINFWNERAYEPGLDEENESDGWKYRDSDINKHGIKTITKNSRLLNLIGESFPASLPSPLKEVSFKILSINEQISFCYDLSFKNQKCLNNLSDEWIDYLSVRDRLFWKVDSNLSGYILDNKGGVVADISASEDDKKTRTLSYGMFGSKIRKYSNFRDLFLDVNELGTIAKYLVDFSIEKENESFREKEYLPHINLTLGIQSIESVD